MQTVPLARYPDLPAPNRNGRTLLAPPPSGRPRIVGAGATVEELLVELHGLPAGDARQRLRARVIEMKLPFAHRLARRYLHRGEPPADLAQVAALALVKAIDGFDPGKGVPFVGYAAPSILGALKRYFRDSAWAMRVPRPIQELSRTVTLAAGELGHSLGHTPANAELAAHLGVGVTDIEAALGAAHAYRVGSLDMPRTTTGTGDIAGLLGGPDRGFDDIDNQQMLRPVLARLGLRDRQIITMRYYQHMTQAQIATEIGLSQMHISRLLRAILTQLRTEVTG